MNHTKEQTSRRRLLRINTSAKPYLCASTKHQFASFFLSSPLIPANLTETLLGNGEFGPVYASERVEGPDYEKINQDRYNLLGAQLSVYDKYSISWSIWLYKDIGVQGMLHTNPNSKWNKTIQSFLDKKALHRLDAWGVQPSAESVAATKPLIDWINKVCPQAEDVYPTPWGTERHVLRNVLQTFLSAAMSDEFAELFRGFGKEELEECARSFSFEECVQREGLNRILREHAKDRNSTPTKHPELSKEDEEKLDG